jgi:hypothetical protein
MRFNKNELFALALQPSNKFEKEGVLFLTERQESFFRKTEGTFPRLFFWILGHRPFPKNTRSHNPLFSLIPLKFIKTLNIHVDQSNSMKSSKKNCHSLISSTSSIFYSFIFPSFCSIVHFIC